MGCAFERGMTVLPSMSPCTPCVETVLRSNIPYLPRHDDRLRLFEVARQGRTQRGSSTRGA